MEIRNGKKIKPRFWRYVNGKWDKRAGLVTQGHILDAALRGSTQGLELYPSSWVGRLMYHLFYGWRFAVSEWGRALWGRLNTDQRLNALAIITSSILSVIAIVLSIVSLCKD